MRQNFKPYLLFFSVHAFFGMIYLWSEMLTNHPWFGKFLNLQEVEILDLNQICFLFISILLFSTIYQIASRRATLTPDTLDLTALKQMKIVIFWENLLLGLFSWVMSIVAGLLLSLLLFPLFAQLMETPVFPFVFPFVAIGKSALFFVPSFLISAILVNFLLYPKKNTLKLGEKWQANLWVIISIVMLIGLYVYIYLFSKQSFAFSIILGVFFIGATVILVVLDRKVGYISIFSKRRIFGGRTGKVLAVFLAVLALVSSVQDMKILITSYQTQRDYYQENAFTFYLEALYRDKTKLPLYEQELEQALKQKKVSFHKHQVDFLVLQEASGERSPLMLSYSQYEKVAKQLGQASPKKLKENEAIYFFTTVNSPYIKKSETDKKSIAFIGYPTAFQLDSKTGSFIPGYDVVVAADEVYEEIRNIRTATVDYSVLDRYVLYTVSAWMKADPIYTSPELEVGSKLINQIETSPEFISNQDHILNRYVGENKDYELTVRSPYGMGVNNIHFLFLSLLKGLIGLSLMLFVYERSKRTWWVSFYYPLVLAILASFAFSIDKISITAGAICIQVIWIHFFFCMASRKKFSFHR